MTRVARTRVVPIARDPGHRLYLLGGRQQVHLLAALVPPRDMPEHRPTILNVALNEPLLKSRSAILEKAGYEVVAALNLLQVEAACKTHRVFSLVIIGYALPKEERRRVIASVRQRCGPTPILELYPHGTAPVDEHADEQLPSPEDPNVLLTKISEVLAKKRKGRRAAP